MGRLVKGWMAALALGMAAQGAAAQDGGTLTVGAYPANPPWEFKNEQSEFEGFEVDLVEAIAERLGMEVEFQDLGFQALFAATSSGRIDMAISTITITDERLQNQDFTQGYFDSNLALVSASGSDVDGWEAMRGEPVGAISASVGEAWIAANAEEYGLGEYRGYADQQGLLLDAANGRIAGAVGDLAGFEFAAEQNPGLRIVTPIETGDRFAIMMPKGSELLGPVNDAITALKEEGVLAELHEKWLGIPAPEGSSTVEPREIPVAQ